jgi:Holliday junction resolvasome RuvABC endonuclease subunit
MTIVLTRNHLFEESQKTELKKELHRILAIDPSLTCSGWALFHISSGKVLGVGKIRSLSPSIHLATRLRALQTEVRELYQALKLDQRDIVICEAPTTMRDPKAAIKVEQVRCVFEVLARDFLATVPGRVNPKSVHTELLGFKGAQPKRDIVKESARNYVTRFLSDDLRRLRLPEDCEGLKRHQDLVDALLLGVFSLARIGRAMLAGLDMERALICLALSVTTFLSATFSATPVAFAEPPRQGVIPPLGKGFIAQKNDPRGVPEITICSQNLNNFGSLADVRGRMPEMDGEKLAAKTEALAKRFSSAGCDLIGVQEILGSKKENAFLALSQLSKKILAKGEMPRDFEIVIGDSKEISRCGFLIAKDKFKLLHSVTYDGVSLPKLIPEERSQTFTRAPLEVQLRTVPQKEGEKERQLSIINFHLKSKRGGWKDAASLEYETLRMAMAEALRRIVLVRHQEAISKGVPTLVLLGDRNSHFDSASAAILEGRLTLNDFRKGKGCRVSGRGVPLCLPKSAKAPLLFSVISGDPETALLGGSIVYNGVASFIDDILLPESALLAARAKYHFAYNYLSGMNNLEDKEGSDHALVWVKLNW